MEGTVVMVAQYVILVIYILILVAIAIYSNKKAKTTDDFMLGGRKIGAWMSAFAYGTTYFSAVMFVGYAGQVRVADGRLCSMDRYCERSGGYTACVEADGKAHKAYYTAAQYGDNARLFL